MNNQRNEFTQEQIDEISNNSSVVDYFLYLEKQGIVNFERKTGHDFYFRTENNKYSVNNTGFYDFKTGEGGGIIKAIMNTQNKTWKEALEFLQDFSGVQDYVAERKKHISQASNEKGTTKISNIITPNNEKLITYFKERGISKEVLEENTQQIHFTTGDKKYFGIGLENLSGGYEIRNPLAKTKIGKNDISVIKGNKEDEILVFEGMTDALSFLQLQKENNRNNNRTLIILNSITNADKFTSRYENFKGKIFLCLDGDKAGNYTTEKILNDLKDQNIKDIRPFYNISENTNNDLNDYLKHKLNIQNNNSNLATTNSSKNEHTTTRPGEISGLKHMGDETPLRDIGGLSQKSQSQQNGDNPSGYTMGSDNAGDGLTSSERSNYGESGAGRTGSISGTQQKDAAEDEGPKHSLGGILSGRSISDRRSGNLNSSTTLDNNHQLDALIQKYRGQKLNNDQITEVVSLACFVSDDKTVQLYPNITITNDLKNICNQFKSGGTKKEGRGILDEYYTDHKIVQAVGNLIKDHFRDNKELSVLEPSIGLGNFVYATENFGIKSEVTGFEINETTAKIAKLFHPEADINLRSFETEFIDEKGNKTGAEEYSEKYDLIIGNPPYGEHRGLYKGLGEEPKISKYEDYFVKRGIDSLKPEGILAMVLPSTWLNRQKKLSGAELINAYRLPSGAFAGTGIGTDIIILKKNQEAISHNISNYFEKYPLNVLGETREKSNRFGRMETYVHGTLEKALLLLDKIQKTKHTERIGNLFEDLTIDSQWENISNAEIKNSPRYPVNTTGNFNEHSSELQKEFKPGVTLIDKYNGHEFTLLRKTDDQTWEAKGQSGEKIIFEKDAQHYRIKENTDIQAESKIQSETHLKNTNEKIDQLLLNLENIKFKSPTVAKEIEKYRKISSQISTTPDKFSSEKLSEIQQKADKIIETHSKNSERSKYLLQSEPQIKKGILKYQFSKQDDIVDSALQNNPDITPEQIEAFKDTEYDGTLNNYGKHYKYANYYNGEWVHDFYYAEGNIYEKLQQLEIDKDVIGSHAAGQYEKQKALLESILPKPKALEEISISPNHEFVHKFDLGTIERLRYNYDTRRNEPVIETYSMADKFKDFVSTLSSEAFAGSSSWEVRSFVDNETVTGSDKERNALVRERRKAAANDLFSKFIREELSVELKDRFVKEFNKNYNNIHVPNYSNFPLFSKIHKNFKGEDLNLTEVQKAGIGRLTTKGVGLLAHEVGFGKTLSGILSMHEAMERGNAKRPLIVVPNDSILKQWVETIFETIPGAKVNILGNLGKEYDLSKFDNHDREISIVTYEGFNNIGFSEEITQSLASKFSYISESELKSVNSISERDMQIEMQKEKEIEGKMKRGKIYDWEDFGFDHLTYDEVHNANHIVGKVKIEDRRFASDFRSQNQQTSKLGINTWMAAQYIQDKNNGRNVSLLSATPFTNKPLEYYSILSLIANKRLEESGYFNVNNFFETFMEADNDMEMDAKGDVKFKANVRRFKNNALFQQLLSEFIDMKGEEDNTQLKRPNRINKEYKIEQNDLTFEQYQLLNDSFSEKEKGAILTHILNARLIAISPYLSPYYDEEQPTLKDFIENSPKLKLTMDLIRQNKMDMPETGQIIYSELAVAEFPKLKDYLISEVGYHKDEIGIITGATSKNQRINIQNDFNTGKIKVIIGSEAIQEGMNLQENTSDLYLLSLPYNFTSLRQTEGRAWRQGNKWENVRINFMLMNDSIDVFMLQKLQAKQSRYLEAMKKGANVVDISDINTQELKTSIITNPETRADIEIELMKKRIESDKNRLNADSAFVLRKYEDFLKIKEKVSRAQEAYNTAKQLAGEDGPNTDYWNSLLPYRLQNIEEAKAEVSKVIQNLEQKGVNVTEIENQTAFSETKIAKLDKMLEDLPSIREKMVSQYHREKQEKLKANEARDHIKEREKENRSLFSTSTYSKINIDAENKISTSPKLKKKEELTQEVYLGRKR
ncbi:restriction endonuclease subunit R [Elizabethkingia meningoseptica]|uniref:Eco57I restriction-modification methylase domain-containing protein n=1 Tax=Elizabethkingia meningoseptica TaxID=238 RepID=UPI00099A4A35|nr:helicase-related protein [Elizabethkingia meningoseptica]OPC03212.1 restriction endonuclease subunit R [Elizabethkingia meningoseptica]